MSRTGALVVAALILGLVAAAVLVWSNNTNLPGFRSEPSTTEVAGSSPEAQLVALMTEVATAGGVAATFTDNDLPKWKLAQGHKLERYSLGGANATMARLTSAAPFDPTSVDWYSTAATFTLPLEFAQRTNGKKIEVGIVARSPSTNASPVLSAVYATQQAGNSGWKPLALSGEFKLIKFEYDVPAVEGGYQNAPILAFHSDAQGAGRSVEILGAYARLSGD